MQVTFDQFFVFTALFSLGFIFGMVYFFIISPFEKKKSFYLKNIVSIILFIILFLVYQTLSVYYKFPNFRWYMPCSILLGFIVYYKTFRVMLAKLLIKVYNILISKRYSNDRTKT